MAHRNSTTTKEYKVTNFDLVSVERDRFMLATNDILNGTVTWSGWHREGDSDGKYRVGLSRLEAADGGLMIVTYRHPGQSDYTTVNSLDGMASIGFIQPALMDGIWEARRRYDAQKADVVVIETACQSALRGYLASEGK